MNDAFHPSLIQCPTLQQRLALIADSEGGFARKPVLERLQKVAADLEISGQVSQIDHIALLRDPAVARASIEPVSTALTRGYLRTDEIRVAHSPMLMNLHPDDGCCDVQGWHCDFPYLWGSAGPESYQVPVGGHQVALGVQRTASPMGTLECLRRARLPGAAWSAVWGVRD